MRKEIEEIRDQLALAYDNQPIFGKRTARSSCYKDGFNKGHEQGSIDGFTKAVETTAKILAAVDKLKAADIEIRKNQISGKPYFNLVQGYQKAIEELLLSL